MASDRLSNSALTSDWVEAIASSVPGLQQGRHHRLASPDSIISRPVRARRERNTWRDGFAALNLSCACSGWRNTPDHFSCNALRLRQLRDVHMFVAARRAANSASSREPDSKRSQHDESLHRTRHARPCAGMHALRREPQDKRGWPGQARCHDGNQMPGADRPSPAAPVGVTICDEQRTLFADCFCDFDCGLCADADRQSELSKARRQSLPLRRSNPRLCAGVSRQMTRP